MRGFLLFLALALPAAGQDFTTTTLSRHVLTNDGVVALAKAGFDETSIVQLIRTSRTRFDTTVPGLVALKQAGLNEDLIDFMAAHDSRVRQAALTGDTSVGSPEAAPAAPAAKSDGSRVVVDKHWWGFHWVRVR